MKPSTTKYPVFEANQVLASEHLNQIHAYLDEQERLTRANLIGIGIVCGLDLRFDGTTNTIHLSRGCGVTSEGYLLVEPEDVALSTYRTYVLPNPIDYPLFHGPETTLELWELFPADEPNTTALDSSFLGDKAVVLFLELKQEGLRTCSPESCDDRGAEVTVTLRRLLIRKAELDTVLAATGEAAASEVAWEDRLQLPDLRLPRWDVPNTGPVSAERVLLAFQSALKPQLVQEIGKALSAAHAALAPLLAPEFQKSAFPKALKDFETAPNDTAQVRFLQYYWDLCDDLITAYDELRWKAERLLCACCPSQTSFPRHLMLGPAKPQAGDESHRHFFVRSPALGGCEDEVEELRMLFQRLLSMLSSFTNTPLPGTTQSSRIDPQIRITPSRHGDVPLSAKAIPYYYQQTGKLPLYQVWSPEKTRRQRAHQNLSYRADEYKKPKAPEFVTEPLRFDLEPHNFLRIEGHLGKPVHNVLTTLLSIKSRYRLPVEIIALRTGAFDESMVVDLSKESCRFQDLEALYDSLKAELLCFLCKQVQFFYDLPFGEGGEDIKPKLPLLARCAPTFLARAGTLGHRFEGLLSEGWPGVLGAVALFGIGLESNLYALVVAMSELSERPRNDLRHLDFARFEEAYKRLTRVARQCEGQHDGRIGNLEGTAQLLKWEELDDRLEDIRYQCRLDPFRALHDEYKRRVRDLKQRQFLGHFLKEHPGIQHKAGVPLGGTFVVVYHDTADLPNATSGPATDLVRVDIASGASVKESSQKLLASALARLQKKPGYVEDPDIRIVFEELTGQRPVRQPDFDGESPPLFAKAIAEIADGTVIADFFLPYLISSDCPPPQYMLPLPKLNFTVALGCTNAETGKAAATIVPQGATGKVYVKIDALAFTELIGNPLLTSGTHKIVISDDIGAESPPQTVEVPKPLGIGKETIKEDEELSGYQVSFDIVGGVPPYSAVSGGTVEGAHYTSPVVPSGPLTVTIADHAGCKATKTFEHTVDGCELPCAGGARRCGYLFWLPEPREGRLLTRYGTQIRLSGIAGRDGATAPSEDLVFEADQTMLDELNKRFSETVQGRLLGPINEAIQNALHVSDDWFRLGYLSADNSRPQTLTVEHFDCDNFRAFEIMVEVHYEYGGFRETRSVTYTADGTVLRIHGQDDVKIPTYGCETINKCEVEPVWKPLCEGFGFEVRIESSVQGDEATLTAISQQGISQYVWEVEDGLPSVLVGQSVKTHVKMVAPWEKRIRLTAISGEGCTAVVEGKINVG